MHRWIIESRICEGGWRDNDCGDDWRGSDRLLARII